mmetsp:Transcript_22152/g.31767  ORF Transcript_22152/g.31767 Transcript_22152/m.31767 type:complete len:220 (-) Transcript_22152:69-728(-)
MANMLDNRARSIPVDSLSLTKQSNSLSRDPVLSCKKAAGLKETSRLNDAKSSTSLFLLFGKPTIPGFEKTDEISEWTRRWFCLGRLKLVSSLLFTVDDLASCCSKKECITVPMIVLKRTRILWYAPASLISSRSSDKIISICRLALLRVDSIDISLLLLSRDQSFKATVVECRADFILFPNVSAETVAAHEAPRSFWRQCTNRTAFRSNAGRGLFSCTP